MNNTIKSQLVSGPQMFHHILLLPTHFTSRTFSNIGLQSNLNKLASLEEIGRVNNEEQAEQILVKEDEISVYEKRGTYKIGNPSRLCGITEEIVNQMSFFLFFKHFWVRDKKLCLKSRPPIIMYKPYLSPKERNNYRFNEYMAATLLKYRPFTKRNEITNLSETDLKAEFYRFKASNECPLFVKKEFDKANEKKVKKSNNPGSSQDELEKEALESSSGEETEDEFQRDPMPAEPPKDAEQNPTSTDQPAPNYQAPPIARFTEAYQEYGHMAPKGMDYEGTDIAAFDDDKDVLEEIRILSDEQDIIFDHSKEKWQPMYPHLIEQAKKAEKTLHDQIGDEEETGTSLDPSQLDPTQTLFLETVLDWTEQSIQCKKEKKPLPPLKMKLLGVAGTGKSRTIKTLIQEMQKKMEKSDLDPSDYGKIVMCAPTGVAAFNIGCGAASIHKTFNIPVRGKFQDLTGDAQEKLESAF